MYEITIDTTKNFMILTLKGFMQEEEIQEVATQVISGLDKLTPGFTVINDISEFKPATASASEIIKGAQLAVFKKGVGKVIRVEGDAALARLQFTRTQKEARATYEVIHTETMSEALKLL